MNTKTSPSKWSVDDVSAWLKKNGIGVYAPLFAKHYIDGSTLVLITEDDLRNPPLRIPSLGDIKKISIAVAKLRQDSSEVPPPVEPHKVFIALLYSLAVSLLTSIVMVVVHDRVPDQQRYPPLPDLLLDALPIVPSAFSMCERIIAAMSLLWTIILLLHRHRLVLLRRMFALAGTIFLLRCCTMLLTSLSVPAEHLECAQQSGTLMERAVRIWLGLGMSLRGVRSCGDYLFSGHSSVLTLLVLFIFEYSSWRPLHVIAAAALPTGLLLILLAHEHYSIDVFLAVYLAQRLFAGYHLMAGHLRDQRTRVWFPLFAFFEGNVLGKVPNEFVSLRWPFARKLEWSEKGK